MTINYLLYMENKQPFIETIEKVHEMLERDYKVMSACKDFFADMEVMPEWSKEQ